MHMSFTKIETYTGPKHQAPQDCQSAKGERCDICFAPMPVVEQEHPTLRAARMIKELHLEQIAKMNTGFVFNKKLESGELVNCNEEMRVACLEQIELCNKIIEAPQMPTIPEIGNYDHKTD